MKWRYVGSEDEMQWKRNMLREHKEMAWLLEWKRNKNWSGFIYKRKRLWSETFTVKKDKTRIGYCLFTVACNGQL